MLRYKKTKYFPDFPAQAGFTLLEVLVALSIFAAASMIAYRALDIATTTKSALDQEIRFWRELGQVFDRMESDLLQSTPHPLSGDDNTPLLPPMRGGNSGGHSFFIELVRQDENRSPIHTLYLCDQGRLTLHVSPVPISLDDDSAGIAPRQEQTTPLLRSIESCDAAFLNAGHAWLEHWPGEQIQARPRAVRIRIAFNGHGQFERIFLVP